MADWLPPPAGIRNEWKWISSNEGRVMVRDVRLWGRIVAVTHDDRVKCDCGELVPASIVGDVESPHRVARPISECRPHVDLCDEAQWTDRPRVRWASERIW